MATLAEVIKSKRQSGQGRTSSLIGSLKDKLKEKIDPRQLFKQTGILTALFPKLKAFKAGSTNYDSLSKGRSGEQLQNAVKDESIKRIEKNTQLFAKNTLSLRLLSVEVSIMSRDVSGLLKAVNVKPSVKADAYFKSSLKVKEQYESKFKEKDSSRIKSVSTKQKRSSGLLGVLGVVGGLGVAYLLVDFFQNNEKSILSDMNEKLSPIVTDFSSDMQTFISSSMSGLEKNFIELQDRMAKHTDKFSDDFEKVFSMKTIEDYFMRDISPTETFSKSVEGFKNSMMQELSNFSFIPSAQAATLPSSFPTLTRPGAAPGSSGLSGNENEAIQFFISKGWTKQQAAGIVGNLIQESNLNPAAYNKKENAQGIAQWRLKRIKDFEKKYGKSILSSSFREQLEYVNWELNNTESEAGQLLRRTTTPAQAAFVVDKFYERSAGTERTVRIQNAERLASVSEPVSPLTSLAQTALGPNVASRVTRGYGLQKHPLLGLNKLHQGIDIAAPSGTSIFSVKDGKISFAGFDKGYGNYIIVDHNDGTSTLYGHLSRFADGLSIGTNVTKGQTIGFVGSTGLSSGPHLHFELRRNGKPVSELVSMSEQQALVGNQVATNTIIIPKTEIVQVATLGADTPVGRKRVDPLNKMLDYASRTA